MKTPTTAAEIPLLYSENPPAALVDRDELARQMNVSVRTIINYQAHGLPVIARGRERLYNLKKVRAWIERDSSPRRRVAGAR